MEWLYYLLLVLVGMGAGFVQRVSGLGLGIFAMLFLPHFMSSHNASASISTIFSCVTSGYNAIRYRKNVKYKTVLPMLCAALVTVPIAVYFSSVVSAKVFKFLLGAVLIILSIYFIFFNKRISIKPTVFNGVLAGSVGGTLNGLFSTGGPPVVLYLSSALSDNISYFSSIQFYFCVTNVYSFLMRIINKSINNEVILYSLIGIAGCMLGDFIGSKVFDKLDSDKLKKIIYIGMIISGAVMFF